MGLKLSQKIKTIKEYITQNTIKVKFRKIPQEFDLKSTAIEYT